MKKIFLLTSLFAFAPVVVNAGTVGSFSLNNSVRAGFTFTSGIEAKNVVFGKFDTSRFITKNMPVLTFDTADFGANVSGDVYAAPLSLMTYNTTSVISNSSNIEKKSSGFVGLDVGVNYNVTNSLTIGVAAFGDFLGQKMTFGNHTAKISHGFGGMLTGSAVFNKFTVSAGIGTGMYKVKDLSCFNNNDRAAETTWNLEIANKVITSDELAKISDCTGKLITQAVVTSAEAANTAESGEIRTAMSAKIQAHNKEILDGIANKFVQSSDMKNRFGICAQVGLGWKISDVMNFNVGYKYARISAKPKTAFAAEAKATSSEKTKLTANLHMISVGLTFTPAL